MSTDTMAMRHGLDPQQERQLTARSEEYASGLSNPEVTSDV